MTKVFRRLAVLTRCVNVTERWAEEQKGNNGKVKARNGKRRSPALSTHINVYFAVRFEAHK